MSRTHRITAYLALVLLVGCANGESERPASEPQAVEPSASDPPVVEPEATSPGLSMPYRVEPACPGEGCSYGLWIACDSTPLFPDAGDRSPTGLYLGAGEPFEVTTGAVVVEAPTVVAVTRPRRQVPYSTNALTFVPGDTLYVLDYLGEGFFNAWYADSIMEVEAFWPWNEFFPGDDFEFGGDVVSRGSSSFWVRTSGVTTSEAWVWVDSASVAAPNALEPEPAMCR